jgi:hypothetical protein
MEEELLNPLLYLIHLWEEQEVWNPLQYLIHLWEDEEVRTVGG